MIDVARCNDGIGENGGRGQLGVLPIILSHDSMQSSHHIHALVNRAHKPYRYVRLSLVPRVDEWRSARVGRRQERSSWIRFNAAERKGRIG